MSKRKKIAVVIAVIILILILIGTGLFLGLVKKREEQFLSEMVKYKKIAQKLVFDNWNHYKNNENFSGDWWAGKFKHPRMITSDGRAMAFPDGLDIDADGLGDIKWSNPETPFEYIVVSESCSYALLRAVWMRDKETFEKVWKWTHDNIQHANIQYVYYWKDMGSHDNGWRKPEDLNIVKDNLFSWRWTPTIADRNGDGKREDGVMYYRWQPPSEGYNPNDPWRDGWDCASDADSDIALALIFADSLGWGSNDKDSYLDYEEHAKGILDDIWKKCTVVAGGMRYLSGGDNIKSIEPGYLSPFSYRIFDDFDSEHDWMQLVDSSYRIFRDAPKAALNSVVDKAGVKHNNDPNKKKPAANLLPDWINVDIDGTLLDGNPRNEPEFGTDAFRGLWRISVDYLWNKPREAEDILFASGDSSCINFFKWRLKHPSKEFDGPDKAYNLKGKISSIFWHDGEVALFEPNYEPDIKDPEQRINASTGYRANCAEYGVYLSYAYAAREYELALKLLHPMITEDVNGFSRREYIIPEDQIGREVSENVRKNTPVDKRDASDDRGLPFSEKDGWWCPTKLGGYWTIYDQSDWNSQSEYFNTTWAWFGLATFAGVIENLYIDKQRIPKNIDYIKIYKDPELKQEYVGPIENDEFVYVAVKGKDANRMARNSLKVRVSSNDPNTKSFPVIVKLAETEKDSGLFVGKLRFGMDSNTALNQIGASMGSTIRIEVVDNKKYFITRKMGMIGMTKIIEDFENASINDANPCAWWTDSHNPYSRTDITIGAKQDGYYIWKDHTDTWFVVLRAKEKMRTFQGQIYSDGEFTNVMNKYVEPDDSILLADRKTISFSCVENDGTDVIRFKSSGEYIKFDLTFDGVAQKERVFIGPAYTTAYIIPFVLKSGGLTGTYTLTPTKEKIHDGQYALKVVKKYSGKDYPYLGTVLFDKTAMDWSNKDEFYMWVYLKEDVGNIRVDIQDKGGNVAILNGYNPWDQAKGEGWYRWSSNVTKGTDVNRDNVDTRPIKDRRWWKGWSFVAGKDIDKTDVLDMHNIYNIQMCIGPGTDKDAEIYIDTLTLGVTNFYKGKTEPKAIKSIDIYADQLFKKKFTRGERIQQNKVYVELTGKDGNPFAMDTIWVNVHTSDMHPLCTDIRIPLEETSADSGIYRGELGIDVGSFDKLGIVGASRGNSIKLYSEVNKFKSVKVDVGAFLVETPLDDFETVESGAFPASWWTDTLDPLRGRPEYAAGRDLGYYVWKSRDDVWHVRWSADMKIHEFEGTIEAKERVSIKEKVNFEENDLIELRDGGKTIFFKTNEQYGDDGIDFIVGGSEIEFDVKIDGVYYGDKIQVGKFVYKKAYAMPFMLENKGLTQTYDLKATSQRAFRGLNSLQIKKTYNKKDYPYFGKYGLDKEKADFSFRDSLKMMVYLPYDVGTIRVDIEDKDRLSAVLNEYDPWDAKKGPGWYVWDSNYTSGLGVAEQKVQPLPIKDRTWWKGWDIVGRENVDVSNKVDLKNIRNLLFCIGGGDRRDVQLDIDSIRLYRENYHMGETQPKKITDMNIFTKDDYSHGRVYENDIVMDKTIFVEAIGKDGNPHERDRFSITVRSSDQFKGCDPINVRLYETDVNSGKYRGKFIIDLASNESHEVIGAARGSRITVEGKRSGTSFGFTVGDIQNSYVLEDFEDGSVNDKNPVTWWVDTIDPVSKTLFVDKDYDNGVFIYKDYNQNWHLIWNPSRDSEKLLGYINCNSRIRILEKKDYKGTITYKDNSLRIDSIGRPTKIQEVIFSAEGKDIEVFFNIDGVEAKDKIFIGKEKTSPYQLPVKISNIPVVPNYELSVLKDKAHGGKYAMLVKKNSTDKPYPYFGAWGLNGEVSDFSDKDSLTIWMYLFDDPGNIRVDLEDIHGNTMVLNGYNPWDKDKGAGWYLWDSNFDGGMDVDEGRVQPLKIKDRQWWMGWSPKDESYIDVTDKIDIKNVRNIQFSIGGGDKREVKMIVDDIMLNKPNYHFGRTIPKSIKSIVLYKDKDLTRPYTRNEQIKQTEVFFKISGEDGNPLSVDRVPVTIRSDDPRADAEPIEVYATETGCNMGVYVGKFKLGLKSNDLYDVLGVEKGRSVIVQVGKIKGVSTQVGEIIERFVVDDFVDGSVSDKNPVTWWTDTVDPFSEVSLLTARPEPGYYIWKDKSLWHIRWATNESPARFAGSLWCNGKIAHYKFINFGLLDTKSTDGESINFASRVKDSWAGIDFSADSDFIDFDIKQDDRYQGRKVWIGNKKDPAYSIPFRLGNNKLAKTYALSVEKSTKSGSMNMMKIDKKYNGKDYPYFGCWGLRGEVSDWRDKDELYMYVYLSGNAGDIKLEIEDIKGNKGIVNGYNPYDPKIGAAWYKWSSNTAAGTEVKDGHVQPVPIKNRNMWKAWDDNEQAFIDTTAKLDLGNIKNLQFIIGGGETRNEVVDIDAVILEKTNYRLGNVYPTNVERVSAYYDEDFTEMFKKGDLVSQKEIYIEVAGKDGNGKAVDVIDIKASSVLNKDNKKYVQLTETRADSGIFRGSLKLSDIAAEAKDTGALFILKNDELEILTLGEPSKSLILKIGDLGNRSQKSWKEIVLLGSSLLLALLSILVLVLLIKYKSKIKKPRKKKK